VSLEALIIDAPSTSSQVGFPLKLFVEITWIHVLMLAAEFLDFAKKKKKRIQPPLTPRAQSVPSPAPTEPSRSRSDTPTAPLEKDTDLLNKRDLEAYYRRLGSKLIELDVQIDPENIYVSTKTQTILNEFASRYRIGPVHRSLWYASHGNSVSFFILDLVGFSNDPK
jgi:hypothetical protein